MSEATPKKESAEAKKTREQREKSELRDKRSRQLADAQKAAETLEGQMQSVRSTMKRCDALLNHSKGFYEEVNKLAKGKTLLEVTTLVMEQANDIIRDAKEIVTSDVYMDRIKQFVPAGDNPVYPDVLISIRSVRDSLGRCSEELKTRLETLKKTLRKANTVVGALAYFLEDDEADETMRNYPSKDVVEAYVDGEVSDSCFSRYKDSFEQYFDFERLDYQSIREYLSMRQDGEADDAGADTDDEEPAHDSGDLDISMGIEEEEDDAEDNGA